MTENRIAALYQCGQSLWLDYIHREMLTSGEMKNLVARGDITGVTSNPTIFEKAIDGGTAYDAAIQQMVGTKPDSSPEALYEALAIEDIRLAADILRPVYDRTSGMDGFVSLEVSPKLAFDTSGTLAAARRLFKEVERANVLIKLPATDEGIPAVQQAISEGININITLMFSLEDYERVAEAYIAGLEDRAKRGQDISRVASVASFFVSRIDTAVDKLLPADSPLRGKIAIANAKLAYARFQKVFSSPRFGTLTSKGARVQRPLWASTGTKDPSYSDVLYIEELVGPDTVNTAPPATIDAFRDHGIARPMVTENLQTAQSQLAALKGLGIDFDAITRQLKMDGVASFAKSFDSLLNTLARKREALLQSA